MGVAEGTAAAPPDDDVEEDFLDLYLMNGVNDKRMAVKNRQYRGEVGSSQLVGTEIGAIHGLSETRGERLWLIRVHRGQKLYFRHRIRCFDGCCVQLRWLFLRPKLRTKTMSTKSHATSTTALLGLFFVFIFFQ